jgi:amidohydrolase
MSLSKEEWKLAIQQAASKHFKYIRSVRQHIHQHPELSFQEFETSKFIQEQLKKYGISFTNNWVKTGILAEIKGKSENIIALRADLDALPIEEKNECDYASINKGIMHACGHDVHSASVLGAAIILQELKDFLPLTVQFVFQPGEEKLPGGAKLMLEEEIFNKKPIGIIAQHVYPSLKAGKVGFREGIYMASTDEIFITVTGKGGHAAMPHQLIDPVIISANVLVGLQQISSRLAPPLIPTVLSFGKVLANGATNVIPEKVNIEGTFRTFDEKWRLKAHEHIHRITTEIAHAYGASAFIDIKKGYPVLVNDELLTKKCRLAAEYYLGNENIVTLEQRMTAEDFAWFAQEIPACFYRLGTSGENGAYSNGVHTSNFNIEEKALETGMGLIAWLAVEPYL